MVRANGQAAAVSDTQGGRGRKPTVEMAFDARRRRGNDGAEKNGAEINARLMGFVVK